MTKTLIKRLFYQNSSRKLKWAKLQPKAKLMETVDTQIVAKT